MAIFDPNFTQKDPNAPAPIQGSGGGVVAGSAAGAAPKAQGSGFTNLQKYVTANQGSSGDMAGAVAQNLSGAAKQGITGINNSASQFNQGVDQATTDFNPHTYDMIKTGNLGSQDQQALKGAYQGQYTGPSMTDYQDKANTGRQQLSGALGDIQGTQDQAMRQTLLQQQYGQGGQYSHGQSSLDSALLGADPQAKSTLDKLRGDYSGFSNYADHKQNEAQDRINAAAGQTQAIQQHVQGAVGDSQAAVDKELARRQTKANAPSVDNIINQRDMNHLNALSTISGQPNSHTILGPNVVPVVQNTAPTLGLPDTASSGGGGGDNSKQRVAQPTPIWRTLSDMPVEHEHGQSSASGPVAMEYEHGQQTRYPYIYQSSKGDR